MWPAVFHVHTSPRLEGIPVYAQPYPARRTTAGVFDCGMSPGYGRQTSQGPGHGIHEGCSIVSGLRAKGGQDGHERCLNKNRQEIHFQSVLFRIHQRPDQENRQMSICKGWQPWQGKPMSKGI